MPSVRSQYVAISEQKVSLRANVEGVVFVGGLGSGTCAGSCGQW